MLRNSLARGLGWTAFAFALLLAWDASGLDLPFAHLFATPAGFVLRDNGFLVQVMHEGAKSLSWLLIIALAFGIVRPVGFLRALDRFERTQLVLSMLAGVLVVTLIKHGSRTSCPWDLDAFGGAAHYVSHWAWGQRDGGPGHCFPAGHASAAFAFLGGYFVLARRLPLLARRWLLATVAAGLVLGLVQQLRGAHYMSHTLWTGWLCWTTGLLLDLGCQWWRSASGSAPSADATTSSSS